ncbi:MAG: MATE family efflux transporter [Caldisericia bacterium]|nr:MATE family efflux transporter [Caldisericia bacterium]
METDRDFTKGSIFKNLIAMAWPGIMGRFFENVHDIIDLIWIGFLGGFLAVQSQAALVLFGVVFMFMFIFNNLFGLSSVSIISRYWGEKDFKKAAWASEQTILFKFTFGIIGAILGLLLLRLFLGFAGADTVVDPNTGQSIMGIAINYGTIIVLAIPFYFTYFTFNTIFRCTSDAETSMFLTLLSVLINIILDPFMILGIGIFPRMGVAGAALATVFAQMCAFVLGLTLLSTGKKLVFIKAVKVLFPRKENNHFRYRLKFPTVRFALVERGIKINLRGLLKPDFKMLWNMIRIGATPAFSNLLNTGSGMIFMNIISQFHNPALLSAFGIGMRLMGLVNMPLLGLQQSAGSLVGQNLGAKSVYRAERTVMYSVVIAVTLCGSMIVVAYLFGGQIFSVFNKDPEVIALGAILLGLAMVQNFIFAIRWMILSAFEGSGYTFWPAVFDQIVLWVLNIPILYLTIVILGLGFEWIFLTGIITHSIQLILNYLLFRHGKWKTARV